MQAGNSDDVIFSATLTPYRSLGRAGFLVLMAVIGGLWFATGLYFVSLGAWPVLGFLGLDVLAVWIAFRLNYREARSYEQVEVSRTALIIRKVSPAGRCREFRFNPQWSRLELHGLEDGGVERVTVRIRAECVPVGAALNPEDRKSFAVAFASALAEARA